VSSPNPILQGYCGIDQNLTSLKDATAVQLTLKTWQDLAKLYWRPACNKVMLFGTLGVVLAWRYRKLLSIS